jgi:hypothetical protein
MKDARNQKVASTRGPSYEPPQAVRLNEARSAHGACFNVGQTDVSCSNGGGARSTCLAGNRTVGCMIGTGPRY